MLLLISILFGCQGPSRSPQNAEISIQGDSLSWLEWMSGTWEMRDGDTVTEERWSMPRGGTLIGTSRTIRNDRVVFFEYLRIEDRGQDAVVYLASPAGRFPPTPFRLAERSAQQVIFTNPEHDFPQTIAYERQGEMLTATIAGEQGGELRTQTWTFHRIAE